MNTFPRSNGHCFSHHVPTSVVKLEDDNMSTDEERAAALVYLRSVDADLVKGDLILFDGSIGYRNDGVAIFDGNKILDLYAEVDDYGSVPPEFHVIENNVPIKYWNNLDETDKGRGISHNTYVWFNHTLVFQECLDNLKYGVVEDGQYAVYTTFKFNEKNYRIIFDYVDSLYNHIDDNNNAIFASEQLTEVLEKCKSILTSYEPTVFSTYSEFYEASSDFDQTLFVLIDFADKHEL